MEVIPGTACRLSPITIRRVREPFSIVRVAISIFDFRAMEFCFVLFFPLVLRFFFFFFYREEERSKKKILDRRIDRREGREILGKESDFCLYAMRDGNCILKRILIHFERQRSSFQNTFSNKLAEVIDKNAATLTVYNGVQIAFDKFK